MNQNYFFFLFLGWGGGGFSGWGAGVSDFFFFTMNRNLKYFFRGVLLEKVNLFHKESKSRKKKKFHGGGGWTDEQAQTCLKKCFKWHFSSSRTTTVQNYFEIHA